MFYLFNVILLSANAFVLSTREEEIAAPCPVLVDISGQRLTSRHTPAKGSQHTLPPASLEETGSRDQNTADSTSQERYQSEH